MRSIKGLILIAFAFLTSTLMHGENYSVHLGQLPSVIRVIAEQNPEKIAFSGEAYSSDLTALKRLPLSVETLDLSQLDIQDSPESGTIHAGGAIPPYALASTGVKAVILPATLKSIGESAFANTLIEHIDIPSGTESIGSCAFYNCNNLKSVNMGNSKITEIPKECFYGCVNLKEASFPATVSRVGDRAFMRTAIKSLNLPNVNSIGKFAFAEMPYLSELTLKKNVTIDDGSFFHSPKLQAMSYLFSTSSSLGFAMSGELMDGNTIDDERVNDGVFAGSDIKYIRIGSNVKEIGPNSFKDTNKLQVVDVTSKKAEIPVLKDGAFEGVDVSKVKLLVTKDNIQGWKEAEGWKDFIIELSAGVEAVSSDSDSIEIGCKNGMVTVTSDKDIAFVGVYSLQGLVLYEQKNAGSYIEAGPFHYPEVVVKVVAGNSVKAAVCLLND